MTVIGAPGIVLPSTGGGSDSFSGTILKDWTDLAGQTSFELHGIAVPVVGIQFWMTAASAIQLLGQTSQDDVIWDSGGSDYSPGSRGIFNQGAGNPLGYQNGAGANMPLFSGPVTADYVWARGHFVPAIRLLELTIWSRHSGSTNQWQISGGVRNGGTTPLALKIFTSSNSFTSGKWRAFSHGG